MNLSTLFNNNDNYEQATVTIRDEDFELYVKRKLTVSDNEYVNDNLPTDLESNDPKYIIAMLVHMIHRSVRVKDEADDLVTIDVNVIRDAFSIDELAAIVDKVNEVQGNKVTDKEEVEKDLKKK
ncbi:hypothetical protein [Vreelandella titanicae]|uniref:Uncharacterized protein n=1 Tax=Vreelandella titanicae TaxID=664683 RepID=A0AAP9NN33_9GAMM|nr:hypothetical protein [Halomonas titanicae]QKS24594.1 hypothetical protein FX987_02376 [Halomonas titanicae]